MSLYFRPEKAVLGDVIPYYDNGVFKPFYLRNYRANRDEQHQDSWVMLSTSRSAAASPRREKAPRRHGAVTVV